MSDSLEAKYWCMFNTEFALHRRWIEVESDSVDVGFRSGLFQQKLRPAYALCSVAVSDILICWLCVKVKWVQQCVFRCVYMFLNWSVCVCSGVSVGMSVRTKRTKACSDSISTCRRCHCFRASASSARASLSVSSPALTYSTQKPQHTVCRHT